MAFHFNKAFHKGNHYLASKHFISNRKYTDNNFPRPETLSYLSVPSSNPLVYRTVGSVINEAVRNFGDNVAIAAPTAASTASNRVSKTFNQLILEIDALAKGFLSLGLGKGDRIGIWGPNSYEWYLSHFAGMKAGLTVVNINPAFQTHEILYCANKVQLRSLIVSPKFKTSDYYGMLCDVAPEIRQSDPGRIKTPKIPSLSSIISFGKESNINQLGTFSLDEIIHVGGKVKSNTILEDIEKSVNVDDVCNIQFTSGTTGLAKGAMLSHHGIVNNALLTGKRFNFNPSDKLCLPNPLFHCFGSVVGALSALQNGSTLVLPSPEFSPSKIVQSIKNERCTIVFGTPTMHISILNELNSLPSSEEKKDVVSSLRLAVTGGAICPEEIFKRMKSAYGIKDIGSVYGLTEVSPVICQSLPRDDDQLRFNSVGYPLEHTEVKVIDSEGRTVPLNVAGELCIRGFLNMPGYCNDPQKTQETIDPAKWLHSGDLVTMSESGHIQIVGRIKDMIIRGGENIYPREIEDFIHTIPGVEEVAVVGVPDDLMGEEVAVWIKTTKSVEINEAQLKDFCKGKIAHYKIPRYVIFTENFPKTSSGKIKKYLLRESISLELQKKESSITNSKDLLYEKLNQMRAA